MTSPLCQDVVNNGLVVDGMTEQNYCLYRQDDNGQVFAIAHQLAREDAQSRADRMTALGHKQTYWVQSHAKCLEGPAHQSVVG